MNAPNDAGDPPQPEKLDVLLGCSCYQTIEPQTAMSMLRLVQEPPPSIGRLLVMLAIGYGAPRNGETLMDSALEHLGTQGALLYHDADIRYPVEAVDAMVVEFLRVRAETGQGPLLGCLYPSSREERTMVGAPVDGNEFLDAVKLGRSVPAHRLGFGLILVPLSLLPQLDKPWMREEWDGLSEMVTPDTMFCGQARAAGCEIRCMGLPGVEHLTRIWKGLTK